MYKIKSLEITNFKSYKSSHIIPFDSHFTCIIGPNGSGKSNILDAIVFVMTNKSYNVRNATVKVILEGGREDPVMTFTRYINNSGKNSYFINNKKTVFKEYINNFIIYQSHTDIPINFIIEQASGSIKYKQEYDVLTNKYADLLVKLKIESEGRKQYLNLLKENKKYEEEYIKNVKLVERKKEIEDKLFNYKVYSLLTRYRSLQDVSKIKENKVLINKKSLLNNTIKEMSLKIDQKQDLINKIDKDLVIKPCPVIPNFDLLEKEYFRLLNNEECCRVEVEDDVLKSLKNEKDELLFKHQNILESFTVTQEKYDNLQNELDRVNNEILLSKNIKAKNVRMYNLKSKIKKLQGVIGFIPDLVKCTNEKYEVAIKALLSVYESTVVVDSDDSAFECIKYCKDHRLGRISCIVLSNNFIKNINSNNDNSKYIKSKYCKSSNSKDLVSPLLVLNFPDNIRLVVEPLLGNILISNKAYPISHTIDVCTIDGVIVRSRGRLVNFYKIHPSDDSLDRRMEILDMMNITKKKLDSFSNIEIIQNKIKKLDNEIESRKIKKSEVFIPETKVFGNLFKINGYKNYSDYVSRNSKYYEEEMEVKHKVLLEKKRKILKRLEEESEKLRMLQVEYDSIYIEEVVEGSINEKEDIEEEIRDLYFIERNEVINISDLINDDKYVIDSKEKNHKVLHPTRDKDLNSTHNKDKDCISKDITDNPMELRAELESINKSLNTAFLIKNTVSLEYNPTTYDSLKKETLEIKSLLNTVNNKRISLFMEYLTNLNDHISLLYSKVSGGSCNLIAENPDEPFGSVKYYVMVPNKKYKDYESLSGGEQMMSRIVFMYALSKLNNKGFLLLDEVDSNLDNYNVIRLVEFIKSEDIQILMVSLKVGVFKESNRMIGVYKKSGVSNILHYAF